MPNDPLSTDIDLLKRAEKGSPVAPAEFDQNLTDIEEAVNGIKDCVKVVLNDDSTFKDNVMSKAGAKLEVLAKNYLVDTGVSNAISVTLSPVPADYAALTGIPLRIKLAATNSNNVTVQVVGLVGTKPLRYGNGTVEIPAGYLVLGQIIEGVYDGTQFQLLSITAPQTEVIETALTGSRNLLIKNNGVAPDTQLDITADEVVLVSALGRFKRITALNKTLDITTAAAVQGRETGLSEAADTWYKVWVAVTADGATTATFFGSIAGSAPNIAAISGWSGDVYVALLGVWRNNGSGNLTVGRQMQEWIYLVNTQLFTAKAAAVDDTYEALAGGDLTLFRSLVPEMAKAVFGTAGTSGAQAAKIAIAATSTGLGEVLIVNDPTGSAFNTFRSAAPFNIPLAENNLYWKALNTSTARITISGFRI